MSLCVKLWCCWCVFCKKSEKIGQVFLAAARDPVRSCENPLELWVFLRIFTSQLRGILFAAARSLNCTVRVFLKLQNPFSPNLISPSSSNQTLFSPFSPLQTSILHFYSHNWSHTSVSQGFSKHLLQLLPLFSFIPTKVTSFSPLLPFFLNFKFCCLPSFFTQISCCNIDYRCL